MALSGSFYNYPVKSFGLYCEWSASQSVTGNYSNVTLKVYLSYWDLYVGARDDGVINIAGNSSNFSTAAISESSSGWKKKLIAQKYITTETATLIVTSVPPGDLAAHTRVHLSGRLRRSKPFLSIS
mgnify:CR=1 FL=1